MECTIMRIDECCVSVSDGDHLPPPKSESGVPFITISNIDSKTNSIEFSGAMYVPREYYESISRVRKAIPGDILYSVVGSFGIPVLIKDNREFVFQRHIAILRPNRKIVIPEFLYYIMRSNSFFAQADAYAIGSAQRTLSLSSLRKMKVAIPSLSVQEKIVSSLSAYDNLIEVNNKRIKVIEQMAENLYKEWFVRFRFPGHETAEFESGSPKNWEEGRLEQFGISLDSGSRPSGGVDNSLEEGMPSLGAEAVNGLGEFDYSNVKLIPLDYYNQMKRGKNTGRDILVYKDGAYIGKTTIFMNGFPYSSFAVNEHVFLLNASDIDYQLYLYFTLHRPEYYALMQNLNRNAAQPGLSKPDMNRIKILVPQKVTVRAFNSIIEPILNQVFSMASQNHILIKQRDLLLPRLMSGKLEV